MSAENSLEAGETPPLFIRKVVLSNFKRFESLTVELNSDINILAGDNEAGNSSVMSAIDLTLSASRSRIENLGVEAPLCEDAVQAFFKSPKSPDRYRRHVAELRKHRLLHEHDKLLRFREEEVAVVRPEPGSKTHQTHQAQSATIHFGGSQL